MSERTFTDVKLVAVQVPETHRTLENDHTVTIQELPGMVTVYLEIDGGRLPFTQLRGADVEEAIERAGKARDAAQQQTAGSGQTQPQQQAATPEQPAPEQPQG